MNHVPVCVKCRVEMRPQRNGVGCLDYSDHGPVAVWDCDMWACPRCGYEALVGFGAEPIAEYWQPAFEGMVDAYRTRDLLVEVNGEREMA